MSGHLYIIRHGITDWNKIHKLQGRTDIPLSAEGIEMAKKACEDCRDIHLFAPDKIEADRFLRSGRQGYSDCV